ncbi:uncharacterized protein BDZ99DRAFT_481367 [Mytilinidion resinicola]|uniref:Uncharacterized protein n=1 Tax=Mytilinidion resinicola TaxID=574789 RepID=A0A6A6Y5W1_9PEZI|nr:uncharacterized protein BDZ99DRAFT_481367 [Mytilinidion resinicola]KAF2804196.1 hypothetical protein BDZ99DRAFT_481367 [Mytilinidion resinicola]
MKSALLKLHEALCWDRWGCRPPLNSNGGGDARPTPPTSTPPRGLYPRSHPIAAPCSKIVTPEYLATDRAEAHPSPERLEPTNGGARRKTRREPPPRHSQGLSGHVEQGILKEGEHTQRSWA